MCLYIFVNKNIFTVKRENKKEKIVCKIIMDSHSCVKIYLLVVLFLRYILHPEWDWDRKGEKEKTEKIANNNSILTIKNTIKWNKIIY